MPEEAVIISTQATRHYGVVSLDPCEKEDDGQPKERDKYSGTDKVRKVGLMILLQVKTDIPIQMTWCIFQGEDLKRDQRVVFPFYRNLDEGFNDSSLIFVTELMHCETLHAPRYPDKNVTKRNCILTADLTTVDRRLFKQVPLADGTGHGYEVYFDLVVTIKAAMMKFSLEVAGKEMGSVAVVYE